VKAKELFPAIFSRHADAYRRRHDVSGAPSRQRLVELLAPKPGESLLDLACGPGTVTLQLAEMAGPTARVVGVDLAQGMLEVARKEAERRALNVRFEQMDIEDLAFANASFDCATCGHGLQFCPDLGRALREVRRVLRDGGRFAASVPAGGGSSLAGAIMDRLDTEHLPPAPEANDRKRTKVIVADLEQFRQAALAAGFATAHTETVSEDRAWPNAQAMVDNLTGWWAIASRLEQLDDAGREQYKAAALEALRNEFGDGPIPIKGASNILYAIA
jgi:SAM-dependent methyltransferase